MAPDLPFFDYQVCSLLHIKRYSFPSRLKLVLSTTRMLCKNQRELIFNDFSDEEAEKLMATWACQPSKEDYYRPIEYTGWTEVPSTYLLCEGDKVHSIPIQKILVELVGCKTVTCSAGHAVPLSDPKKCVSVINEAVGQQ